MANEDNQDKGYEVKDKRRVNADGSLKEDAEPVEQQPETGEGEQPKEPVAEAAEEESEAPQPEKAEAPPKEAEAEAPGAGEEMPPPDVYQTLQFVAGLMAEQAWQFMGLHLPPGHKEPVREMAQAKIAIDTVIFIGDKLHPHLDEESRKALRSLIGDLQLNFIQQGQ